MQSLMGRIQMSKGISGVNDWRDNQVNPSLQFIFFKIKTSKNNPVTTSTKKNLLILKYSQRYCI